MPCRPRDEEGAPVFNHHDEAALPDRERGEGKTVRVVAGSLFGVRSPVETLWDTMFAEARLAAGASLPLDAAHEERAIYIVSGEIDVQGDRFAAGRLLVFRPGDRITVTAATEAHGGGPRGRRHGRSTLYLVELRLLRKERIEQAKADWKAARFDMVPGDSEFIPLPEG